MKLESEIKSSMPKRDIEKVIMELLVHQKSLEQSALGKYQTQSPVTQSNSQTNLGRMNEISSEESDRERRQWQRRQQERQWEREWEKEDREFRLKQQKLELGMKRLTLIHQQEQAKVPFSILTNTLEWSHCFRNRGSRQVFSTFQKGTNKLCMAKRIIIKTLFLWQFTSS